MKVVGGVGLWLHIFLTSSLEGGDWLYSRSSYVTCRYEFPIPIREEAVRVTVSIWMFLRNFLSLPKIDPRII